MENKKEMSTCEANTSLFLEYGDIVSVEDVMRMLHIGKSAVYTLLQTKAIKTVRVGRKYIIPKNSIIKFLEETLE